MAHEKEGGGGHHNQRSIRLWKQLPCWFWMRYILCFLMALWSTHVFMFYACCGLCVGFAPVTATLYTADAEKQKHLSNLSKKSVKLKEHSGLFLSQWHQLCCEGRIKKPPWPWEGRCWIPTEHEWSLGLGARLTEERVELRRRQTSNPKSFNGHSTPGKSHENHQTKNDPTM